MSRLPLAAFAALVVATVGAFFITQHLKVTTPLISAVSPPTAPVIFADGGGPACPDSTSISFYLLHQADNVDVSVVNSRHEVVRTLARDVPMGRKQRVVFTWRGRAESGPAAAGKYNFRVVLVHQRRTIDPVIVGATDSPATVTVKAVCSAA
jgi:flagellar hook assembly protein FlgD